MQKFLSIKKNISSPGGWVVELFILSHRNTTSPSSFSKINIEMRGKSQRKFWLSWVQYATDIQISIAPGLIDKEKIMENCLNGVGVQMQHGCLQKYCIPIIVSKVLPGDAGNANKFHSFTYKSCSKKKWVFHRVQVDAATRRTFFTQLFSHLGKHEAGLLRSAGCHAVFMKPPLSLWLWGWILKVHPLY